MSQFIIATNNASVEQRNVITEHIKAKGWAWWHYFEDVWMAATTEINGFDVDNTTSEQLYHELASVIGEKTEILVIKIPKGGQPMTHYGHGPMQGWEWTAKYWSKVG